MPDVKKTDTFPPPGAAPPCAAVAEDANPCLLAVLRDPHLFDGLDAAGCDRLLRQALRANLLAALGVRLAAAGVLQRQPARVRDRFAAARLIAADHARRLAWELEQLAPVLAPLDVPVVVLKGGAYLAERLPSAEGRLVSDLDLLVPEDALERTERAMLAAAYHSLEQDAYDERYYRDWMHELPPMAHPARGTTVDLHHNIAPRTSRLRIDAGRLLARAVPLEGHPGFLRLGDEDMVLHLCVHMFHDDTLNNSLRELLDLDAMLRRFGARRDFAARLQERSAELGIGRPLYYALRFARELLGTPLAGELWAAVRRAAPAPPLRGAIEAAMRVTLLPDGRERPSAWRALANGMLLARAHWLRMPTGLLLRHLFTQVRRRGGLKTREAAARGGDHA